MNLKEGAATAPAGPLPWSKSLLHQGRSTSLGASLNGFGAAYVTVIASNWPGV
jgi:hypothetical protein